MKLFNKKEEKNKIGRPRLADIATKKKAVLSISIALVMIVVLLLTGAFKLNIIKFNKLKGWASDTTCTSIPEYLTKGYVDENGIANEYGFDDIAFFSVVVSSYNGDATCQTITKEQLSTITNIAFAPGGYSGKIKNTNGIEFLTSLNTVDISNNANLTSVDFSKNYELSDLTMNGNPKLENINLGDISKLIDINLISNNLKGTLDLSNNSLLKRVEVANNKLNEVLLNKDALYERLDLSNNNIKDLGEFNSSNITNLGVPTVVYNRVKDNLPKLYNLSLDDNNESNFDFSNVERLGTLAFYGNNSPVINLNSKNIWTLVIGNTNTSLTEFVGTDNVHDLDLQITDDSKSIKIDNAKTISDVESLTLGGTKMDSLILNNASSLKKVLWNYNGSIYAKNLTITNAINLKSLDLNHRSWNGPELESLNLDGAVNLTTLTLPGRKNLKSVSLKNVSSLTSLLINDNGLTDIDVTGMTNLKTLDLNNNNLNEIKGLSTLINLTSLKAYNNKIKNIQLPEGNKLIELDFDNNDITGVLDLKNYSNLTRVFVSNNKLTNIEIPEQNSIRFIHLSDNNLTGTLNLKKLNSLQGTLEIFNNPNLSSILLPETEILEGLNIYNTALESIDVSSMPNLKNLYAFNNKLSKIEGLDKLINLEQLIIPNNNLSDLNLSNNKKLSFVSLDNNPLSGNIYIAKGEKINYDNKVMLPRDYNINYDIEDTSVVEIKDGVITAKKQGDTNIRLSNENILAYNLEVLNKCILDLDNNQEYCENVSEEDILSSYYLSRKIKVYDITSDVYNIDASKKTIDVSGNVVDVSKITLISNGLMGNIENNTYIIKDGNNIVTTYKILNPGVVKESNSNVKTTTRETTGKKSSKNTTTKKSSGKNNTTKTADNSDIYLDGSFISMLTLAQVKGTDRNIIVNDGNLKFTINGKSVVLVDNNINLDNKIQILKESDIYDEVKKDISKGIVVTFTNNSDIKTKILAELNMTRDMLKNTGYRNISIYRYENGKLIKVAEDINVKDNKISFYINKLGKYVITNSEVKNIETDSALINKTKEVNKKSYIWFIIPIILILLIIGYITYKKSKRNN